MKISHLMITAAVAALSSTAVSAQTAPANNVYEPGGNANVGTASSSEEADFTITGNVDQACVLGAGGDLRDLDMGTIGIYADATSSVENVFTSVGESDAHTRTNLAGCNTKNRMTITKTNGSEGLVNEGAADGGYDGNVFQKNIPYTVMARYTAGAVGTTTASLANQITVLPNDDSESREHGAWKSAPAFKVTLTDPTKALVAGTYTDTVTVVLEAI